MHFPHCRSAILHRASSRFRGPGFEADRSEISPKKRRGTRKREREKGTVSEVPGKVGKSANDFSFRRPDPLEFSIERDSKIYIYFIGFLEGREK